MEGDSVERIAQNFHSDGDPHTAPWGKQKSSYRGTVRKTVRTMIEAMGVHYTRHVENEAKVVQAFNRKRKSQEEQR
ncbi:hypothetical protein [Shinella sp. M27]|uniref:hypothetical protein n=1 Tax=Shinella sp. M27 TaxID=3368614 RepID=UPI003B9F6E11